MRAPTVMCRSGTKVLAITPSAVSCSPHSTLPNKSSNSHKPVQSASNWQRSWTWQKKPSPVGIHSHSARALFHCRIWMKSAAPFVRPAPIYKRQMPTSSVWITWKISGISVRLLMASSLVAVLKLAIMLRKVIKNYLPSPRLIPCAQAFGFHNLTPTILRLINQYNSPCAKCKAQCRHALNALPVE